MELHESVFSCALEAVVAAVAAEKGAAPLQAAAGQDAAAATVKKS